MNRVTRTAFAAAPLCFLTGWVIMRPLNGRHGPGPGWTTSHLAWLLGFGLFVAVLAGLRRLAGDRGRAATNLTAGVALFGLLASMGQFAVDLVAGFRATTEAEMGATYDAAFRYPGVDLVLFTLGPLLFVAGLLALAVTLAVLRRIAPWQAALIGLGVLLLALQPIAGLGAALLLAGLAATAYRPRPLAAA